MDEPVVIFQEGGSVISIYGRDGKYIEPFYVIENDEWDGEQCPICQEQATRVRTVTISCEGREFEIEETYCRMCGANENMEPKELIECLKRNIERENHHG